MINLTYRPTAFSALATRLRLLPLLAFVLLALMLVNDADARTLADTIGGTSTDLPAHGIRVRCTWPVFEGAWSADPESISVSHSAGDPSLGEYATCSGWYVADGVNYIDEEGNPVVDPAPGQVVFVDHENAPLDLGHGKFLFDVTYSSTTVTTCVDDDSGIGNDCVKFTDDDNTGNGGNKKNSDSGTTTDGATLHCANNSPGTTLTYQFYCADGVNVEGYLTLVRELEDENGDLVPQVAPRFTRCSEDRVAAGDCTMLYGGVPMTTVKIKGVTQEVVDAEACLEAFPQALVPNALNSGQVQSLEAGAMLFYQEVAYEGSCDATGLPTQDGSPSVAHGRYCQSDIDTFDDNIFDEDDPLLNNVYPGDPLVMHGFDNELRKCFEREDSLFGQHVGFQDVETVELAEPMDASSAPTLNLNCTTGDNTDSGKFKVWISDQATLLADNVVVTPLSDAPKLEGVSPIKAVINTDEFGVDTLELTYPTCNDLSNNIIEHIPSPATAPDAGSAVRGQAVTGLTQTFNALIEVKVNGL